MRHRPRVVALSATAAILAALCACSPDTSDAAGESAGQPHTIKVPSGLAGNLAPSERKLVTYDRNSGAYRTVAGDASSYTPNVDRKVPPETVLAFGDGQASIPFAAAISKALRPLANNMGFDLRYCDLNLDPQKAITCAHEFVAQKPTVAVIENWQASVADQMMAIYNQAKIPVITVDLPHPNAVYFGVDSFQSGVAAGKAAGDYAQKQWGCKDVWLYLASNPSEGATVDLRLSGFAEGVQSVCGTVPESRTARVIMDQASQEQALSKTTDWLTSKPQATHILATSVDQLEPGITKAFVQNHRDGWVVQQTCDANAVDALSSGDTDKTHWIGCIAFRPDLYPQYFLSLAADVVAGTPVPNEVHFPLELYTHDNIGKLS